MSVTLTPGKTSITDGTPPPLRDHAAVDADTTTDASAPTHKMAGIVERNIDALMARRERDEAARPKQDKIADVITRFTGSMRFVVLHLLLFGGWIGWNVLPLPLKKFDPQLITLAMWASVEAIFLSTFVLISQNRAQETSERQAQLDLQVNLLAEHEITRLVELVSLMAEKMGIEQSRDPELRELAQDVLPERVLGEIERAEQAFATTAKKS